LRGKIAKQVVGTSSGFTKNDGLDIVEVSAPSEAEKEDSRGVRAGKVGAQATRVSFVPQFKKRKQKGTLDNGDTFGFTGILVLSRSGRAALKRE
jgi:hypothetical protein